MGQDKRCDLYKSVEREIDLASSDRLKWIIEAGGILIKSAERKLQSLTTKEKIEEIRMRLENDREQGADTARQRFKDLESLLEIIDKKSA